MRLYFLSLFLLISFYNYSQGEANNWYFGNNAGITFNTSPPTALLDGALSTNEGCSSISAPNGDLLFYTDGRTVWNRNHLPMENANYSPSTNFDGLNGDPSSTSSGLIVPHPTNTNLYFVFTLDEPHHDNAFAYPNQGPADQQGNPIPNYTDVPFHEVPTDDDGFNNGLNYSVVDMSLNNGLGDVIPNQKNIELITYDPNNPEHLKFKASEKITAVRGGDCSSIWIIVHFIDSFYAFKIDENGIDETPVISTAGPSITTDNYRRAALGYMKASPDGTKIVSANNTTNYNPADANQDAGDGNVYLFDFDNNTGVVSNAQMLIEGFNAYGVAFSSNSTKAYATTNNRTIWQWDLTANDVPNSGEIVVDDFSNKGGMQLAPDGKIYVTNLNQSQLGVIENPEEDPENLVYNQNGISLSGRTSTFGLPPFIQSLFLNKIDIVNLGNVLTTNLDLCENESYTLGYDDIPNATYTWKLNDEVVANQNSASFEVTLPENVNLPYTEFYTLEVDLNDGSCPLIGTARVTFSEIPEYQNATLTECVNEGETVSNFNLNEAVSQLLQDTNLTENQVEVSYFLNFDDAINEENSITEISSFQSTSNNQPIIAKITQNNCTDYQQITLISGQLPELGNDTSQFYCLENLPELLQIDSGIPIIEQANYSYSWNTGQTTPSIGVNQAGIYTVTVTNNMTGCSTSRSHEVIESNIASFDFEVEDTTQENNTISIIVTTESLGDYEYALEYPFDFQDEPLFEGLAPGIYDVFVRDKNGCGTRKERVGLLGVRDFFTPNNDGVNDFWQLEGIVKADIRIDYIQVFDRYGKHIASFSQESKGWDGTYKGKPMPSNDYWYVIKLQDGLVLKGNFTLKR
ncbi:gliding motility-associated C-terminal domain-containing protein [Psychroflexus salarius]|uniref:Gliding motility-associated C-terminal domain-containing protein n=1 Tax=Psychroflexus salarius TaxID=1155689 RepID=A0A1M4S9A3_9FLAO|nr:T9SS type B sorting domain-containing protein [Psychroflexus salarius]SHE28748.1 gliding motility-associated C-terminal domain-containing protein [Psychroflexus salarius]